MSLSLSRLAVSAPLALLLLAGCGGPTQLPVTGKVVLPDKAKLVETDTVTLVFTPEEGDASYSENANASVKDLTFKANLRPGKYKISVTVQPYAGQGSRERPKELAQQFGGYSPASTPLRCEITSEPTQTLTVDLNKKSVEK